MQKTLVRQVRDANRRVYESKDFDEYEENPSIFEVSRQDEIEQILHDTVENRSRFLDVGCGTGNVLRLARRHFKECWGVDLSCNLLAELARRQTDLRLIAGEADQLPFLENHFDMISMYGVLHHLVDHASVFRAVYRVLKPGGALYADHDPNYYFGRFYHFYYRMRYLNQHGFGTEDAEMSEWHHTRTGGLNPFVMKALLLKAGFSKVDIHFRITTNPALSPPFKVIRFLMRSLTKLYPFKSLYTHFWIVARK